MEQSDESRGLGTDPGAITGVSEPMGASTGAMAGEEATGQELVAPATAGEEPRAPATTANVGMVSPLISEALEPVGTLTVTTAATREEPWALVVATTEGGPGVPPSTVVGSGFVDGKWPLVINSPRIPIEDILDEIAARESDSGVGGGDTEEIITDEGGDEVVAEMEVDVVEAMGMLGRTREETGKAPMVMQDAKMPVPIFDRPARDSGAKSTWRVTLLDYEEFVEDDDVFEAELEEPGIAVMVFEARAREAEREELLRHSEPEGNEVLKEFEQEAAGAEIVPRVSAMQEAQKAARVAFNPTTYAPRAHFFVPQLLDPYNPTRIFVKNSIL